MSDGRLASRPPFAGFLCRLGLVAALLTSTGCADQIADVRTDLAGVAMRGMLARADAPSGLRDFYSERGEEPLWIVDGGLRPEAKLVATLARDHGLNGVLQKAENGMPQDLARAELALSKAFAAYAVAQHGGGPPTIFPDPARTPPRNELGALRAAAGAPSLEAHLRRVERVNPLYAELLEAYAGSRSLKRTVVDDRLEKVVRANLERLRALPAELGERYVIVDIPAARLWLYENGRPVDSMRVIVGRTEHPTPLMAATLRYAIFNPYWNVPEDLARDRYAPMVLREGVGALERQRMEVLSDWSTSAVPVDPRSVDWPAVAQGRVALRLRQKPGPRNGMGSVKFMMPNKRGIYLHDTPDRADFRHEHRLKSAGCVRVEDAERLARWLGVSARDQGPEQRVALATPVPIYLVYRTVALENGRLVERPDVYGLDRAVEPASRV